MCSHTANLRSAVIIYFFRITDRVVRNAMGLSAGRPRNQSISGRNKETFLLCQVFGPYLRPTQLSVQRMPGNIITWNKIILS